MNYQGVDDTLGRTAMPSGRMWRFRTGDLIGSSEARHGRTGPTRILDATRIRDPAAVEAGRREPHPHLQARHQIFPERASNVNYNLWF